MCFSNILFKTRLKSQLRHNLQQKQKSTPQQEVTQSNDACNKAAGCGLLYLHSFLYDHIRVSA